MDEQKMQENENLSGNVCASLGTVRDPQVCYSFPNKQNYCYRIKNPEPINLDHQNGVCLTENHKNCILNRQTSRKHLPDEILGKKLAFLPTPRTRGLWIIVPILIVFVIMLAILFINSSGFFNQPSQLGEFSNNSLSQLNADPAASVTPNPINLLFLLPQKTPSKSPAYTQESIPQTTPTMGPGISTPFGTGQKYLIHLVLPGESVHYLAEMYNLSALTIIETNSLVEGIPIQENQLLVIQSGGPDKTSVEKLTVLLVEKETSLQSIADNFSTTINELMILNELGSYATVPAGRWLIVPVQ